MDDVKLNPIQATEWRDVKATAGAGFHHFFWSTANSYNADGFLATKNTDCWKDKVTSKAIPGISDAVLSMRRELDAEAKQQDQAET